MRSDREAQHDSRSLPGARRARLLGRCCPGALLCAALGAGLPGVIGCLPESTPPTRSTAPPSCGNGSCEPVNEDCQVCPEDCPCCAIIDSRGTLPELDGSNLPVATGAAGTAQDPTMAAGQPDGRSIVLDERSELTLAFGREVFDYFIPAEPERVLQHVDFTIHGEVTSTSSIDNASTCTRIGDEQQQGAFGVLASPDGITWSTIGIWARRPDGSQNNQFDIACAQLTQAKYVRIQAAPGATATLDAVTAVIDGTGRACWELAPQ